MQAQLDREGWKRANCFGALLRAKTVAEGDLKTMSAVERVKERRTARQHGLGRGEAGQSVACTTWHEKVPMATATVRNRERREESLRVTVAQVRIFIFIFFKNTKLVQQMNELI